MKPENVPTYAACPWHGAQMIFDDLKALCNLLAMLQIQHRRKHAEIIEKIAIQTWMGHGL